MAWGILPVDLTATGPVAGQSLPVRRHLLISLFWMIYNAQWMALLLIILPSQITQIAGEEHKELISGIILPIGAFIALVTTPIAGALSDRSRSRFGRRRAYILAGCIMNVAFLALLSQFGAGSSLVWFSVCFMGLQFAGNWWGGPYAGLIPDLVPQSERGVASGYMMMMQGLGNIVGPGAAGLLAQVDVLYSYWFLALGVAVSAAITLPNLRESAVAAAAPPPPALALKDFLLDPRAHPDFYIVLATRSFVTMGIFSVFPFAQFFLKDVVGIANAEGAAAAMFVATTLICLPVAYAAGRWADRHGPVGLVKASGWAMALGTAAYVLLLFAPSWPAAIAIGILVGLAAGAYQTVDWALAVAVLPRPEDAGKDMGIWHISFVLPQMIAPAIGGVTIDALKTGSYTVAYAVVFVMAALWFAAGTVPLSWLRLKPPRSGRA